MKANNNTLDKLAFVGLIIFFIMCLSFCMVYNITVKDKSCQGQTTPYPVGKKKESGIVAVHLKSNKTACIIFG